MATDDLDPLALPDGWSSSTPVPGSTGIVRLPEPSGLEEFASENVDVNVSPSSALVSETPHVSPVAPDADAGATVTLLDLLERREGINWREAVAVVQKLCLQLKDSPSEHPIVLDPRNILLTAAGDVRVIPGSFGGDPLVIQVGRLLRTLLLNKPIPPELRLILSQATFELPIFDSVEDVARALATVNVRQDADSVGTVFTKAIGPIELTPLNAVSGFPVPRPMLPAPQRRARALLGRFQHSKDDVLLVATALVATAVCAALIASQLISRAEAPSLASTVVAPAAASAGAPLVTVPTADAGKLPQNLPPPVSGSPTPRVVVPAEGPGGSNVGARTRETAPALAAAVTLPPPPAPRPPENPRPTPQDLGQRAAALVEAGKPEEAEIAFDAFVLNNPLYEPSPTEWAAGAYAVFEASRRVVLPQVAIREFERAKDALAQGNVARALAIASDVDAVLDRVGPDAPDGLRQQLETFVDGALDARAITDGIVYTAADADVVAPRALSRQFPLNPPDGIRRDNVGVLEIIVGKKGDVEFVKLYTPLNRYHERMVVSAAKAWRYRPARKAGTPVRYRLSVTVNLPESGT